MKVTFNGDIISNVVEEEQIVLTISLSLLYLRNFLSIQPATLVLYYYESKINQ